MAMYWTPMSVRRSRATGCWVAITRNTCSRSWRNSSLMVWSLCRTSSAPSRSSVRSAASALSIWSSTSEAMRSTDSLRSCSSLSKVCLVVTRLPEPAGDVVLGPLVLRPLEDLGGRPELDQFAVALLRVHEHERGEVCDPSCLLHVVRHDNDGVGLGEPRHQVLDLERRHRVEGGAGLVHQHHVGV